MLRITRQNPKVRYINITSWNLGQHPHATEEGRFLRLDTVLRVLLFVSLLTLCGCDELVPRDTASLLAPRFHRSEIVGLLAGFGTTFAALPYLLAMLRRRSTAGMNPRMAAIMCAFQVLWVYYGLLIGSRPVVVWNVIAVVINLLTVRAYRRFARKEARKAAASGAG